ncbi:MAG: 16S rRNA (guanine(527)-N(7))-methyltransferase RsmG [Desulfuromonadaceae bacterium]|nr:16S rRNA (guanine(527)-N(7))-methyltransferase RsmG [Desulfuromonadaceae bacterium]
MRLSESLRQKVCMHGLYDKIGLIENKLLIYVHELLRWNEKVNLTALRSLEECWEKHIEDSLALLAVMDGDEHVLDVGSGAGLPSIPLAIALTRGRFDSCDKVAKKITFQKHCKRLLALDNLSPLAGRVEDLIQREIRYDLVVSRAFSSLREFVAVAAPLVKPGGRIVAMKSEKTAVEIDQAECVVHSLGWKVQNVESYHLYPSGSYRALVILTREN